MSEPTAKKTPESAPQPMHGLARPGPTRTVRGAMSQFQVQHNLLAGSDYKEAECQDSRGAEPPDAEVESVKGEPCESPGDCG
jgi:hypothetical protein